MEEERKNTHIFSHSIKLQELQISFQAAAA